MSNQDRKNIEKNEDQINSKDFIIGALIGGIVGAATALFLAPKSGKEIRNDLNLQASSIKEKTEHLREVAKMKGTELAGVAKEKTNTIGHVVTKQSSGILNKVRTGTLQVAPNQSNVEENEAPTETTYISLKSNDIERKLEETKKAFDETESRLS